MNTKDLAERNLIYKVRSGSHAYGTSLPTSDINKINTVVIRMTQDYLSGYHGDTT